MLCPGAHHNERLGQQISITLSRGQRLGCSRRPAEKIPQTVGRGSDRLSALKKKKIGREN